MDPQNPFTRQAPVPGLKHIIVVGSGKGGVGKSTVSVNLAVALKHRGQKVGLLDADIYGPSLPRMLGALYQRVDVGADNKLIPIRRFGISLMSMGFLIPEDQAVVWRGPMLFKAVDQFFRDVKWGELDVLVIDLPPGTGDVALTIAQKVPVDGAITVCTPQNVALMDAKRAVDMFERINIPCLGMIENMSSFTPPGATEAIQLFPKGDLDQYLEARRLPKLGQIPFAPSLGLAAEAGIPVLESDPTGTEAQVFLKLADQVLEALKTRAAAQQASPSSPEASP